MLIVLNTRVVLPLDSQQSCSGLDRARRLLRAELLILTIAADFALPAFGDLIDMRYNSRHLQLVFLLNVLWCSDTAAK